MLIPVPPPAPPGERCKRPPRLDEVVDRDVRLPRNELWSEGRDGSRERLDTADVLLDEVWSTSPSRRMTWRSPAITTASWPGRA